MEEARSPVAERVHRLLEPVVGSAGVELVDVEWAGGILRITVDSEDGVSTETLAEVSHLVSPLLDEEDPIKDRYMLEVTSPGVERPLRRLDHFRRAVGEDVVLKLHPGSDPRRLRGRLVETSDDGRVTVMAVELDGNDLSEPETHTIDLADVAKARTVFDWGPAPKTKAGGGSGSGKKKGPKR